ncbi:MAG: ribulose-phosphate 3-epimerase [Phycisphaerales bacterium JB050]
MPSPRNLLTTATRPLVAPSILSADFARLAEDCAHALADQPHGTGADLLHIDVMDGHFVPNLTMGPALVKCLSAALPEAFLDVHVMVTDPIQYIQAFAEAGAHHLTFHLEPVLDPKAGAGMSPLSGNGEGYNPVEVARACHASGMSAGIAINPPTPIEPLLKRQELLELVDMVLIMSVNPGFSGQAFIPEVLEKARAIKPRLRPDQRLEIDGGVKPDNAEAIREAGVDVLVAASAIFSEQPSNRAGVVTAIRGS